MQKGFPRFACRIGNCVIVAKRKKGGIIEEEQKEGAKKRRCPKASFFEVI